jgi:hypothetical protein
MTDSAPSLIETLQRRFELGRAISAVNARKLSRQQACFGAEITMQQQLRDIEALGDSPARQAVLAEAARSLDEAQTTVADCNGELAELETQVEALDRQIAASR